MVQREIADRLAAKPGTKAYGIPSVLVQLACEVEFVRPISRNVFRPAPNVDSALVRLRRTGPAPSDELRRAGRARRSRTAARRWRARCEEAGGPAGIRAAARDGARGDGASGRRARRDPRAAGVRAARARAGAARLRLATRAPAKLNLCLYVGPRRPDGLHEIRSVFQPITLADELTLTEAAGGARRGRVPRRARPEPRGGGAGVRFAKRFGWDGPPVRVTIEKHIPVAAGLGGGSADAAAVLRLAAAASQQRPPQAELADLAMSLGADVPSQLQPRTALVTGAGEGVEPLPAREVRGVLLAGRGALATASVYARADELGLTRPSLDGVDTEEHHNDLQGAAVDLEPEAGRGAQPAARGGRDATLRCRAPGRRRSACSTTLPKPRRGWPAAGGD